MVGPTWARYDGRRVVMAFPKPLGSSHVGHGCGVHLMGVYVRDSVNTWVFYQ